MASDGSPIDVSILEALIELRKQQAQVDQFVQRAEERKDKVESAVYTRVMADYGKRRADLEAQAAPLVIRALVEYRTLKANFDAVRATQAAARLDKEEVEFRHALGEVDDATQSDRLKEPERLIAETTDQLAGLDKLAELFTQALPNVDLEAALQAAPAPAPPPPAPPAPEPVAAPAPVSGPVAFHNPDPESGPVTVPASGSHRAVSGSHRAASGSRSAASGSRSAASGSRSAASGARAAAAPSSSSGTVEVAALQAPAPAPADEPVEFADEDQTRLDAGSSGDFVWPPVDDGGVVPVPIAPSGPISAAHRVASPPPPMPPPMPMAAAAPAPVPTPAPAPAPAPAPPSGSVDVEDRTFIVPEARLLSEADNGQAVNFPLTALTYIGRSEDNQLRLLDPGVSRRHVLVMATPGGYTIRDLGSQNGTYVNGSRVDESPLTDGDRITIGEINLVFRGAPAAVLA
jgi:hypothetical protein